MKYAADFRYVARDALHGKWSNAVFCGFVASLLGAGIATNVAHLSNNMNSVRKILQDFQSNDFWPYLRSVLIVVTVVLTLRIILMFIIGGAVKLGYAIFNLKLVDKKEVSFSELFSQRHRIGDGFCMYLLTLIFTILWSLLLIIPGIIKSYSYAMTPYILAEHPEMTAREAITESRRIMNGNKWRLFCLGFSFFGWSCLCAICGLIPIIIAFISFIAESLAILLLVIPCYILVFIVYLFLISYQEAAHAAFYREISRNTPVPTYFANDDRFCGYPDNSMNQLH